MRVYQVADHESAMLIGLSQHDLPSWATKFISITPQGEAGLGVTAKSYVGTIPLLCGGALHIIPRVGVKSFSRMLLFSEGLHKQMDSDELRAISSIEEGPVNLASFLGPQFEKTLVEIEKSSPLFRRERVLTRGSSLRGSLVPSSTALALLRREHHAIHSLVSTKSRKTDENLLLGIAATELLRARSEKIPLDSALSRWSREFGSEKVDRRLNEKLTMRLSRGEYEGARGYYVRALSLARLILYGGIQSFSARTQEVLPVTMLGVADLFEKYVRKQVALTLQPQGCVVCKVKEGVGSESLFSNGTNLLLPDILVTDRHGKRIVGDVKYKPKSGPTPSDYYQLITYLRAYKTQSGFLVYPLEKNQDAPVISTVKKTFQGDKILEIGINMRDWENAEYLLAEKIESLID